ncbi:MAG TPA: patatin-like phospholipase family protein [Bryobacteraceae bacterium]|nr:patatin-like phospholipase family protein [Bryobacteraceae bacterium]
MSESAEQSQLSETGHQQVCPGENDKICPRAVPFADIQTCEHDQILERRSRLGVNVVDSAAGHQHEHSYLGLAISGGGIRSATFSLGIIQKLAEFGILKHIDYLSTVSGGGYIGSWLCSWIRRRQAGERPSGKVVTDADLTNSAKEFEKVCAKLSRKQPEAHEITFLRQYSNYLTPRVSVFNADTWLVGAIWFRNTLLNLAILVAAFGSAVLVARLLGLGTPKLFRNSDVPFGSALAICAGLLLPMVALIGWNLWWISTIALEESRSQADRKKEQSNRGVLWFCLFPLLSAFFYSFWLYRACGVFIDRSLWDGVWPNFAVLFFAYLILQLCGRVWECHIQNDKERFKGEAVPWHSYLVAFSILLIGPAGAAFVTAALLRAVAFIFYARAGQSDESWFVLAFGPPLVLLAFTVGVIVHMGLMGRDLPEASREWLSRLRAWLMIFSFFWIIVFGVSIYGPWLMLLIGSTNTPAMTGLGSGWILTTAGGLFAGKSAKTSAKKGDAAGSKGSSSWAEILATLGPYLFMAGFSIAVALGVHAIVGHGLPQDQKKPEATTSAGKTEKYNLQVKDDKIQITREPAGKDPAELWNRYWLQVSNAELCVKDKETRWFLSGLIPLLILLLGAGVLLAWRVDINNFSMHNFYKSRLVRCYLGASRLGRRHPNPFTGFDDYDDSPLDLFITKERYIGPYPILNAALNVTSGGKLQYQERQAQSYVFTPYYTGFSSDTVVDRMRLFASREKLESPRFAYRPTRLTGGRVGVGMAMATSGAAVNPNMGYHSSTAVSFLLTVFNVRLGWWLGNTLWRGFQDPGPRFGWIYMFRELLGLASADSRYVNLSDGGHFENMGIYELVRRKCRYIICCDGEQDSGPTFGGIGNAIRKCRTDFGVEIDLPLERLRKKDGLSRVHCAVGEITYPKCECKECEGKKSEGKECECRESECKKRECKEGEGWDCDCKECKCKSCERLKCDCKKCERKKCARKGYIVYLKTSLTGDESTDIRNYSSDHPDFPQQTTADQWFDESQFESYRKLGYHVAEKAFSSADCRDLEAGKRKAYFDALYQVWYPPSKAVDKTSPAHGEMYARIMESIRGDKTLEHLDPALFQGYDFPEWDHDSGHICNSLIQLMQRVFYDLGLEDKAAREHPFVEGWLNIFRYWVRQPAFEKAWKVVKNSYPDRFRAFYESLV